MFKEGWVFKYKLLFGFVTHDMCNTYSLVDVTDHLFKISVAINVAQLMKAKVIDNYIK